MRCCTNYAILPQALERNVLVTTLLMRVACCPLEYRYQVFDIILEYFTFAKSGDLFFVLPLMRQTQNGNEILLPVAAVEPADDDVPPSYERRYAHEYDGSDAPIDTRYVHEDAVARRLALRRPVARVFLASIEARRLCTFLRAAWSVYMWDQQIANALPLLRGCRSCGHPTGMWCSNCRCAMCSRCDDHVQCPDCGHGPAPDHAG